jgi:hypothetical protein
LADKATNEEYWKESESRDESNRYDMSSQRSINAAMAIDGHADAAAASMEQNPLSFDSTTNQERIESEDENQVTSSQNSNDGVLAIGSHIDTDIDTEKENEAIVSAKDDATEKEKGPSSPLLPSEQDGPEDVDEDADIYAPSEEDETSPSDDIGAAAMPPHFKSRLSMLLSLRPPPPTQRSILRRKCIPAEDGSVYDGTTREALASNPTSDRHFGALAAFEASSTPSVKKNAGARQDLLVIDLENLCDRMDELFPDQFSFAATPRSVDTSFIDNPSPPPCILPRLIACYTIYRDHQRLEQAKQHQEHVGAESPVNDVSKSVSKRSTKRRRIMKALTTSISPAVESLDPIQTLLQTLVDLEWNLLQGHEHRDEEEGKSTSHAVPSKKVTSSFPSCWNASESEEYDNRKRRVQFAAFDDTAVIRAPSDVLEGSYKPQENCVNALLSVLDAVENIFPKASTSSPTPSQPEIEAQSTTSDATAIVRDFIFYLDNEFISQCHDTICVESLMSIEKQNIPVGRVEKAAVAYSRELNSLINPKGKTMKRHLAVALANEERIGDNGLVVHLSVETIDVFVRSRPLTWECRLANTSAQLVRYWLRTILNPIPERSDVDTKTDQWNSRLYDFVQLTEVPEEEENNIKVNVRSNFEYEGDADRSISTDGDDCSGEVYDDDKVSSLLSNAVAHLHAYLDLGSAPETLSEQVMGVSWNDRFEKAIPDETCCATTVCSEGLGTARKPVCLMEDDWQELREELERASDFCAFHRRALFIERLLSIVEELNWVDHWTNTVQAAAEKLLRMKEKNSDDSDALGRVVQPADEHLVILGMPLKELLNRLRTEILPVSCQRYEVCRVNLRRTEKNFRLGLSMTKRKKKWQPNIGELEAYWKDMLHPDTIFPSISFRGYALE